MYQQRIRDIYEHLSPGYRRIADFLLKQYQEAAFMTAAEVGRSSNVDTTLVVRFAQRLGYPGFPELIDDIQDDVKRDLQAVYEPAPEDQDPVSIVRRNLIQDRNNLQSMLLHMDTDAIQKAVAILKDAPRIFIAAEGNAIHIAQALATRLVVRGFNAYTVPSEPAGQAAILATLREGDAFVGLGTTLMTPSIAAVLKVARSSGAQTIGVVGSQTNPVATAADVVILAPALTAGLLPSWTAMAALSHGLVQALASTGEELSAEWALRTDHLLSLYQEAWKSQLPSIRDSVADYNVKPAR